jgi:hypothetical protein
LCLRWGANTAVTAALGDESGEERIEGCRNVDERCAEAQVSGTIDGSDIMIARQFALALAFAVSLSQFRL